MKKLISKILCSIFIISSITVGQLESVKAESLINNPVIQKESEKVTYDCIYYGSYPQREVISDKNSINKNDEHLEIKTDENWLNNSYIVDPELYNQLKFSLNWFNNELYIDGSRYIRVTEDDASYSTVSAYHYYWDKNKEYHYFKYEPIKWLVIDKSGSELFLVSEVALDSKAFNENRIETPWKNSTLRSWLNGYSSNMNMDGISYSYFGFIDKAFTEYERGAIIAKYLTNDKYSSNDTIDKIFLLSVEDVENEKYGLASSYNTYSTDVYPVISTTYARAMGAWRRGCNKMNIHWWLRTSDESSYYKARQCFQAITSGSVTFDDSCVRPAMYINISNLNSVVYAGKVSTDGKVISKNTEIFMTQEITTRNIKKFKASKLKKKKAVFSLKAKSKTKRKYKVISYPSKGKKYISVNSKGTVTLKRGTKKGKYVIEITAQATKKYKEAKKYVTIVVKK